MTAGPLSTSGYGESAGALVAQYESISFADVHGPVLHLFPPPPARVLDIGAGTGRDAAALAAMGHAVTAVEPTTELRRWGQAHHPASIRWMDDMLPGLPRVLALREQYDLVMLTAVWMHLDESEQRTAMATLAALLAPGGRVAMTLRHGPVPEGRRMFEVGAAQVASLAVSHGLALLHTAQARDAQDRPDVHWTFVVLNRAWAAQACHTP